MVGLRRGEGRWKLRPPTGYGLALPGVAVFLAGGVADTLWHQIFGVEAGVDALLSPTHLVLLVGGMLMVTAPARTAGAQTGLPATAATALSAAATAAPGGFFLSYLSVFADPTAALIALPTIPEGAPGHREAELPIILGLGGYLVTTGVIVIPLLALRRLRASVPSGVVTATVAATALLGSVLSEFRFAGAALAAVAGAAAFEAASRLWVRQAYRWLLLGAGLPVLTWSGHLAGLSPTQPVVWTVELWSGIVVLSGLAGAALVLSTSFRPASTG